MLRILTRTMRRRAASLLALAYLACVILPPLALTFADGAMAAHCLVEDHHVAAAKALHAHDDGTVHQHAGHHAKHETGDSHHKAADSDGKATTGNCCGLFCLNATAADAVVTTGLSPHCSILPPSLQATLGGLAPHRIDRPPMVLLSL